MARRVALPRNPVMNKKNDALYPWTMLRVLTKVDFTIWGEVPRVCGGETPEGEWRHVADGSAGE
jgi:hypothetical protein